MSANHTKLLKMFNRVVIPWFVTLSYWRSLEPGEVDQYEFVVIAIPEEPILLGAIQLNRPDSELQAWAEKMKQKCDQLCRERDWFVPN